MNCPICNKEYKSIGKCGQFDTCLDCYKTGRFADWIMQNHPDKIKEYHSTIITNQIKEIIESEINRKSPDSNKKPDLDEQESKSSLIMPHRRTVRRFTGDAK